MLVKSTLVRALTLEQEADRLRHVSAQPTHSALGFGTSPGPDPLSMHYDHVPALPGTNPCILSGGLGSGVSER